MNPNSVKRAIVVAVVSLLALGMILPALGSGTTRVWVEFQPGRRGAAHSDLQRAGAKFHYTIDQVSAFVVTVPENALPGLRRNPNIVAIEVDPVREVVPISPSTSPQKAAAVSGSGQVVPYGVDMVQARNIWDANRDGRIDKGAPTGAGVTVCIIDTGLYTGHEDLQGVNILGGWSQTNPDPTQWIVDGYGHGTHVAGTIAAMNNTLGVVGVTPGTVSLYIVKIFDDAGNWVVKKHASDLAAAALDCAAQGSKVISMSLSGTTPNGYEERVWNQLYAKGILPVAAASNDGIEQYHYPASYDSVISVAALDSNYTVADFSQHNDKVELAAPGVGVLSTVPFVQTTYISVEGNQYTGYQMEFAPFGTTKGPLVDGGRCLAPAPAGVWSGKVVLCERGDATFFTKVMNVQSSGGLAAVIYNNVDGDFAGTLGEGNTSSILSITINREYGLLLLGKTGAEAEVVSLAAQFPASGYEAWDGTSMATPHVSAVAALLWSWNPNLTNVQIRAALQQTAMDLGQPGRDNYYGYGLVQAYDAWTYLGGGKPGKK